MELVVLGSGTANPHPRRSSAAFWLETENGSLMLDFSASALHRLAQENLDWANLDAVWISHFHLDHCCGLAAYLFATKYAPETINRTKPLRIFGGRGIKRIVENFDKVNNYRLLKQPFPVEIIEVEQLEKFEILASLDATAQSTPHTYESHAIRITDATDFSLVYTSDTGFGKQIATFARDADMLIIESSFVRNKKTEIHLELAEAMYLISKSKARRAMLTHLYADWDKVDFANEVGSFGPRCEIIEAVDGLRVQLSGISEK